MKLIKSIKSFWNKLIARSDNNNENKNKKRLMLFTFLPITALLAGGGITCGVLAATTDIFNPRVTKTNIKDIFDQDAAHWMPDITSVVTTGGYSGDGYVWNTTGSPVENPIFESNLRSWLKEFSDFAVGNEDIIDNLSFNIPSTQNNNSWIQIDVSALPRSKGYTGSFYFYVFIQLSGQGTLAADFTNTSIDLSGGSLQNVTLVQLFNALKNQNVNLNTNAIKFQYDSDPTAGQSWTDWDPSKRFGIGSGSDVDQTNSLISWSTANDRYDQIRIAPGGEQSNYYDGQTPITFNLKLNRAEIKDVVGWKSSWDGQFYTTPNSNSFVTRFDTLYYSQTWFSGKLEGAYEDTYGFNGIGTSTGTFWINGNPFYQTHSASTTDYQFSWTFYSKVAVATLIIDQSSNPIDNLNNVFYEQPSTAAVIQALQTRIKSDIVNTIAWNEITITVDASTITLKGSTSSVSYTADEKTITYTLKS